MCTIGPEHSLFTTSISQAILFFFQIFNSSNNLAFPNSPNSRLWMDPDSSLFFIAIIIYT